MTKPLSAAFTALRAHDVHQGLREVDRNVGHVGRELKNTQLVGMAAALATSIKGQDVIEDAHALETVAAEQLDIDRWAFPRVVELLESVDFVRGVVRRGGEVASFFESVPLDFDRLYEILGRVWTDSNPGEIESSLLESVDLLSRGPLRVESLDVDPGALSAVLQVGQEAEAIRVVQGTSGSIAYSPFFAYENPEAVADTLRNADVDEVRRAFEGVRAHQGLPSTHDPHMLTTTGLIEAGLIAAPAVERPDGSVESFAVAPYGYSRHMLTIKRPVVDKALAVVAAVRTGQYFGGVTSLRDPVALLQALHANRVTARHSSSRRQYAVLRRLGIICFVQLGDRYGIQLVDNDDNREAVGLAIDLISSGEVLSSKENPLRAQQALATQGNYLYPIQTLHEARKRHRLSDNVVDSLYEAAMGRQPVE